MRGLLRVAVGLLGFTLAGPAGVGAQLQAGPVLLEIAPQTNSTRLLLQNTSSEEIAAQVRIYAWSQDGGEDQLEPSEDLAASPPIVRIPAGGQQVVRVVRTGPPALVSDLAYRVVVDELPREGGAGVVALRMRYVIPAFVRAAEAPDPLLVCGVDSQMEQLFCENHGGRPAQLGRTYLSGAGAEQLPLSTGLFGYVLPGARRTWTLPPEVGRAAERSLELITTVNGETTTVPVSSPT